MNFKLLILTLCLSFSAVNAMKRKAQRQLTYPDFELMNQEIDQKKLLAELDQETGAFNNNKEQAELIEKGILACSPNKKQKKGSLKDQLNLIKKETLNLNTYSLEEKIRFAHNVKSLYEESSKTNIKITRDLGKLRQSIINTFHASPSGARQLTPSKYKKNN